jgi:SAM-dependent methyltransferase
MEDDVTAGGIPLYRHRRRRTDEPSMSRDEEGARVVHAPIVRRAQGATKPRVHYHRLVVAGEEGAGRAEYILGHSAVEQARLDDQSVIIKPFTERLLGDAGIGRGMTVIDAGCGTGDVTLMVASLVGSSGSVVGIDRAGAMLATARARAAGLPHVRFVEADLATYVHDGEVDAVVGRCVLYHQRDGAALVARLAGLVRPAGVVAFAEPLLASPPWLTRPRPLLSTCMEWMVESFRRAGARNDTGLALPELFADAGLPAPEFRFDGIPTVGPDARWLSILAGLVRSALPAIERFGVASAEEVGLDTLLDRLLAEGRERGGAALAMGIGSAWTRLAG